MTRYNSKLRARDLKKANAELRSELKYKVQYSAESHNQLWRVRRNWRNATIQFESEKGKLQRQLRNNRILSGILLVLVIAGWLA